MTVEDHVKTISSFIGLTLDYKIQCMDSKSDKESLKTLDYEIQCL